MKSRFRIIDHTADYGLVSYGDELSERFANAAVGMFSLITDLRKIREKEMRVVELEEDNGEALLFAWLNELIYLFDVQHLIFRRFVIEAFDGQKLKAQCYGEKFAPERHVLKTSIKSATYYMLRVEDEKKRMQVIFDI